MKKFALKLEKVDKTFKIPKNRTNSLKQSFLNFGKHGHTNLHILKDISFTVKKGEFFGIVGRNGSGKSTLLKLIAGIYRPTRGSIQYNGHLTPFIELGVGFNMELSGRDNVFLNGAILGLTKKEVEERYDEIVEFAELHNFMDQKLKNYSSGMLVRLAFAVAIQSHNDILLIDEVLAVGDANFQRKCFNIFKEIKRSGKTVIFVTHDMGAVQEFCDRAMLIDSGKIVAIGKSRKIAIDYELLNLEGAEKQIKKINMRQNEAAIRYKYGNGMAEIKSIATYSGKDKKDTYYNNEPISIKISAKANEDLKSPTIGIVIQDGDDNIIFATNTEYTNDKLPNFKKGSSINITCTVDNVFTNGDYRISAAIASSDRQTTYSRLESAHSFRIEGWKMPHSRTHPEHNFIY